MGVLSDKKELVEKVDDLSKRLDDLIENLGVYINKAEKKAVPPPPPKIEPDPRIGELMIQMNEIRDMVKRAATPPPPPPKEERGITDFLIVLGALFAVSLLSSGIVGWFYKPAHHIDYSERVLYNQCYGAYGSSIGLFESEEEAARKIENQRKYELENKK